MMLLFFEIFGLLLLLPRARRALARAETRARASLGAGETIGRSSSSVCGGRGDDVDPVYYSSLMRG